MSSTLLPATEVSPLVVVVGPTGAGKSVLGLEIALRSQGEIVNCDSVQVYRRLDIGSAKFSLQERRGVPHHLIDIIDPDQELTAGAYARIARNVLADIRKRRMLPVVVGGTGFYLRALLEGLSPAPIRNERLRSRLTAVARRRPAALHRLLTYADPASADRIHANDHQKLIRAIELSFLAGSPASEIQQLPRDRLRGYRVLKIGLCPDRSALREAINQRTQRMFSGGLLAETEALLQSGVPSDSKALQTLGYKQATEVLTGVKCAADAQQECQAKTRQYAKRQLTWFRADRNVMWLNGFGNNPQIQARADEHVTSFLAEEKFIT